MHHHWAEFSSVLSVESTKLLGSGVTEFEAKYLERPVS